jgi:hypothetical protein
MTATMRDRQLAEWLLGDARAHRDGYIADDASPRGWSRFAASETLPAWRAPAVAVPGSVRSAWGRALPVRSSIR